MQLLCSAQCIGSVFIMLHRWHHFAFIVRRSPAVATGVGIKGNPVREECRSENAPSFLLLDEWVRLLLKVARCDSRAGITPVIFACLGPWAQRAFPIFLSLSRNLSRTNDAKLLVQINFRCTEITSWPAAIVEFSMNRRVFLDDDLMSFLSSMGERSSDI